MVSGADVGGAPRSRTGDGERGDSRNMTCSLTGAEDGERGGTGDGEWGASKNTTASAPNMAASSIHYSTAAKGYDCAFCDKSTKIDTLVVLYILINMKPGTHRYQYGNRPPS